MSANERHMEEAERTLDLVLCNGPEVPDYRLEAIKTIARALATAERRGMERAGWKPIETLALDGREVQTFSPEQGQAVWPATDKLWRHVTHWAELMPDPTGGDE